MMEFTEIDFLERITKIKRLRCQDLLRHKVNDTRSAMAVPSSREWRNPARSEATEDEEDCGSPPSPSSPSSAVGVYIGVKAWLQ